MKMQHRQKDHWSESNQSLVVKGEINREEGKRKFVVYKNKLCEMHKK